MPKLGKVGCMDCVGTPDAPICDMNCGPAIGISRPPDIPRSPATIARDERASMIQRRDEAERKASQLMRDGVDLERQAGELYAEAFLLDQQIRAMTNGKD